VFRRLRDGRPLRFRLTSERPLRLGGWDTNVPGHTPRRRAGGLVSREVRTATSSMRWNETTARAVARGHRSPGGPPLPSPRPCCTWAMGRNRLYAAQPRSGAERWRYRAGASTLHRYRVLPADVGTARRRLRPSAVCGALGPRAARVLASAAVRPTASPLTPRSGTTWPDRGYQVLDPRVLARFLESVGDGRRASVVLRLIPAVLRRSRLGRAPSLPASTYDAGGKAVCAGHRRPWSGPNYSPRRWPTIG